MEASFSPSGEILPAGRQGYTRRYKMYFVYVIKSLKNDVYYKGLTSNLEQRLIEHNNGKTSSNRLYKPFKLVFVQIFQNLIEARIFEKFLKSGYGREIIKEIDG